MSNIIETEKYRGCTIEILQDDDAPDPRAEFNVFGTMACWHSRYLLGDKDGTKGLDAKALIEELGDDCVRLPLYLYDHSGLTMNTCGFACSWDSGQVGFIYATYEEIEREYGEVTEKTKQKATDLLIAQVEEYDHYLRGDVVGWATTDFDGNMIDLCWGYYGWSHNDEYVMNEAKVSIDSFIENDAQGALCAGDNH